jgi:hypothetical protein
VVENHHPRFKSTNNNRSKGAASEAKDFVTYYIYVLYTRPPLVTDFGTVPAIHGWGSGFLGHGQLEGHDEKVSDKLGVAECSDSGIDAR